MATKFEYEFWTVAQLQRIGLTSEFATSFNYFVRDVAGINTDVSDVENDLAELTLRVDQNESDISQLKIDVDNVEQLAANNASRLGIVEPKVDQNTSDIASNFLYLNGYTKPNEYSEISTYLVFDIITNGDKEEICVAANGPGVKNDDDWESISVVDNAVLVRELANAVVDKLQFAAYGGLFQDAANVPYPDIDGTWKTISVFDSVSFSQPRNITQNLPSDSLAFEELGVYEVSLSIVLSHNESNNGRKTNIRLFNVTDNAPSGALIPISIGRNQPGTNFTYSFPVEVSDTADLNDQFVIQIGGGDTLTNVSFDTAGFYIKSIGEYRGELPATTA